MFFQLVKEFLFPRFCVGCGQPFSFLCRNCFEKVEFYTLDQTIKLEHIYLDRLVAVTYFKSPISLLIKTLKYQRVKEIGITCARLLYETADIPTVAAITGVPLHWQRLQERGFNQTEIIGQELAKLLNIPYFNLLKRTRAVVHQASITDKCQRKINVRDTFAWNERFQIPDSVLIVDDVTTTGATLNECARILKQQGVKFVYGLALARGG